MEFGKIRVKIKGLTPLLMNRLIPEELERGGTKPQRYNKEEEARKRAYIAEINGEKQLYIPARWIYSMLVKAAASYKAKGKRSSLSSLLAGTIRVEPEKIPLGTDKYEIDERPVRIQQSRVLAWRPKINNWEAEFYIIYNKMWIGKELAEQLRKILEDGAIRLGIGDFRPQHKGWFGTFTVEEFEIIE